MSIGSNIKRLREQHSMTQEDFGKIAKVSSMAVSQWENDRAVPRMGALQLIADYFHISKSEIVDDSPVANQDSPAVAIPVRASRVATVPLKTLGRVHAGPFTDEEETDTAIEVPASVLDHHPRAFALLVEGDCMNKVIPEGSHVLVDPDREPSNGSIAVVETDAYQAVMRRWYRGATTLMLSADSFREYDDMLFSPEDGPLKVLGVVIWYQSANEMELNHGNSSYLRSLLVFRSA